MEPKPKIKARNIVNDIRSHMTDPELMAKYDLSARGLQSAFIKLLDARAITQAELDRRPSALSPFCPQLLGPKGIETD
jgi:hypothetical protein